MIAPLLRSIRGRVTEDPSLCDDNACESHEELYEAEYLATYMAAGRLFAHQLRNQNVNRYDKIEWMVVGGDECGTINLDLIQCDDLLTLMKNAGL